MTYLVRLQLDLLTDIKLAWTGFINRLNERRALSYIRIRMWLFERKSLAEILANFRMTLATAVRIGTARGKLEIKRVIEIWGPELMRLISSRAIVIDRFRCSPVIRDSALSILRAVERLKKIALHLRPSVLSDSLHRLAASASSGVKALKSSLGDKRQRRLREIDEELRILGDELATARLEQLRTQHILQKIEGLQTSRNLITFTAEITDR
jgi:hypothetical protein